MRTKQIKTRLIQEIPVEDIFNPEVIQTIAKYISPADVLSFGRVCQYMHYSVKNMDVGKAANLVRNFLPSQFDPVFLLQGAPVAAFVAGFTSMTGMTVLGAGISNGFSAGVRGLVYGGAIAGAALPLMLTFNLEEWQWQVISASCRAGLVMGGTFGIVSSMTAGFIDGIFKVADVATIFRGVTVGALCSYATLFGRNHIIEKNNRFNDIKKKFNCKDSNVDTLVTAFS